MAIASIDIPLGTPLPSLRLPDPDGRTYDATSLIGEKGLLLFFTCNHCPYAKAVWPRLLDLSRQFKSRGINAVAVNPNINPDYPEDAPEVMKQKVVEWGIDIPYLVDASQEVARSFKAQCTPDIYLFDSQKRLVYHGRVDDNWQEPSKVTAHELREAMEALVSGQAIRSEQHPTIGCSIKWV